MSVPILTYSQVTAGFGSNPKLLIGNGFSIACCPDIFTYRALLEEADFSMLSANARTVFDRLNTKDFEAVIKALDEAADVSEHYNGPSDLVSTLRADASGLKDQLAHTIAKRHPEHPSRIHQSKYAACRQFLKSFRCIYSLNYDLLLYWTIMRDDPGLPPVMADDGFRRGDLGQCGYVKWDPHEAPSQTIYYMHGALHLFDGGSDFVKYTWSDTDVRLIVQIREALSRNKFPRIVSEGTSPEKLEQITHCAYLHKALRSLMSVSGDLVVYGMSLSSNDDHIIDCIIRGKIERLWIGLYGDPDTEPNQHIIQRALAMETKRSSSNPKKPLVIQFFDASSACVWGS